MNQARKKVLYLITKATWGGAQKYVFDLATHLSKTEFDVAVAYGERGRLVDMLEKAGIETHRISTLGRDIALVSDVSSFFQILIYLWRVRPDIVHLNSSKVGGVGALAARIARVPKIIFTSHGLAWDEDRGFLPRTFIYIASQLTFILCHMVITISEDTHRRAPGSVLIYNGMAAPQFLPSQEARRMLGLAPAGLIVGTIGELTRNKGYRYLLDAVRLIKTPATFVIVSDGEERQKIERRIVRESLPVRLTGFVPDAARLLTAFDIFVMPSVKEGLPYVLIEAGQASLPTVASRIPGITDVLGDTGLLIPPRNPLALAQGLETLLNDTGRRKALGQKLRDRVTKEFSLEQMLRKTLALYR